MLLRISRPSDVKLNSKETESEWEPHDRFLYWQNINKKHLLQSVDSKFFHDGVYLYNYPKNFHCIISLKPACFNIDPIFVGWEKKNYFMGIRLMNISKIVLSI